jgi:hemoglobin/transferrin/lactoferrin receptor protein
MKIHLFVFILPILMLLQTASVSQSFTVRERTTLHPIERATVYNLRSGSSDVSDAIGKVDLLNTQAGDTLRIQHLSYHDLLITMQEIVDNGSEVLLTVRLLNLGEIVVSASKWEEDRRDIPVQIEAISPTDIAFNNPQTSADMLSDMNGVFVQKSQMGGGSPVIRGFEANKVLIVVDGVRMNNAIYRSGHLQNVIMLDPASMENAEIVFGPGSVIYGSDALGGVMDFHTRKPRFSFDESLAFTGGAFGRFATANNEKSGHLHFNLGMQDIAFHTSFSYSDYGDLQTGGKSTASYPDWGKRFEYVERINGVDKVIQNDDPDIQKFTAYSQLNFQQKVRYRFSESLEASYSLYYSSSSDIPRYDRLTQTRDGMLRYAEWYYGPQNWMMNLLSISYNNPGGFVDHARLRAAYQTIDEDRISRSFGSSSRRHQEEDVKVFSINLDMDKDLHATEHRLFYGLEAVFNDVQSAAFSEDIVSGLQSPAATRYPDGGSTLNSFAAYATYKWNLSTRWLFSAGTRYSRVKLNSTLVDKSFFDFPFDALDINTGALNGSIGIVYRPGNQWQLNLNLSSGYRAPNVDDVGKIFDSSPGSVMVPNPALTPEFAYNAEMTLMKEFGKTAFFSATAYYTLLTDAIVRRDFSFNGRDSILYEGVMSKVQANQNTGEARIYGFNAMFSADLSQDITISSSITYTQGRDQSLGLPLGHIPPLFSTTTFVFRRDRFRGELLFTVNAAKTLDEYSPSGEDNLEEATENGTPAWHIFSLRSSYQLSSVLQVNVGLENILDQHYRPFSSGVSAAGRNLVLTLRSSF